MEELSNKGNGNYAYIDSLQEARKVLVDGLGGTLVAIAKDVKVQIFFNPKKVAGYRLIGYANRLLKKEDFNDDTKDAGDIGAGHAVTALYELVPAGGEVPAGKADPNPFVTQSEPSDLAETGTLFLLRLRYKQPDADKSTLLEESVMDRGQGFDGSSADFQWASAVAAFGMLLRDSPYKGQVTWETVREIARTHAGADTHRQEFLGLIERARQLAPDRGAEARYRELQARIDEYRKRHGDIVFGTRELAGRVNAVRGNELLVSVGAADGVQVGDVYHIRRGFTYVGSLRITEVERAVARGEFDTKRKGPAAPPQRADTIFGGASLPRRAHYEDYEARIKELELVNDMLRATLSAAAAIEGRVTSVRGDLVVISVGSADGISVGDVVHLRRGTEFVGRVKIEKVERNLSVGTFDSGFPGVGAPPRKGDIACCERARVPAPKPRPEARATTTGRVTSVRDDLMVVSIGSDDGVSVGDVFHLRRGAEYVGTVKIEKVLHDLSVGTFDSQHPGPGAPPQKGDLVYRDK
jgi:hypothetical protein